LWGERVLGIGKRRKRDKNEPNGPVEKKVEIGLKSSGNAQGETDQTSWIGAKDTKQRRTKEGKEEGREKGRIWHAV